MARLPALLFAAFAFSPALQAKPVNYRILTDTTAINMSWRAFGGIQSWANLKGVTGSVSLDPTNEFNDQINVNVPVATLVASNSLLTWQLKSNMFFDAERYPSITFISDRVVHQSNGHYRVFGSLIVRDIRQPVILDTTLVTHSGFAQTENTVALQATTAISRSAFGMNRFAMVVDDRIAITIAIQAVTQ